MTRPGQRREESNLADLILELAFLFYTSAACDACDKYDLWATFSSDGVLSLQSLGPPGEGEPAESSGKDHQWTQWPALMN